MSMSRRIALIQIFVAGCLGEFLRTNASAETVDYQYDSLGRLQAVTRGSDSVKYTLDNAGNRVCSGPSCLPPPAPPPLTFNATIQVPSGGAVDLRLLANAAGYNGATNATIVFEVANGVTVTGAAGPANVSLGSYPDLHPGGAGGVAIDTGNWPNIFATSLQLIVRSGGTVRGGGGAGGQYMQMGGAGGDAIFCRTPITIQIESGGFVQSGGGGGGGGGSLASKRSSGGGGGAPNGPGGANGPAGVSGTATDGQPGTTSGGGAGGTGNGGLGGAGGSYGATGATGTGSSAGIGGAAGYAIRKNGKTVTVTNSGTITGTVG